MENELVKVVFNSDGTFNILHKESARTYRNLHFFEDAGEAGDGFIHIPLLNDHVIYSKGSACVFSVSESSPERSSFLMEKVLEIPLGLGSDNTSRDSKTVTCKISSTVTIMAGCPRVDVITTIDNRAKDHRLRVLFPSGIETDYSYAGQPFDVVRRDIALPVYEGIPVEKPRPTHPQQRFVDVSDGTAGLMIANKGLYEYEVKDDAERTIAITLLRCVGTIYGNGIDSAEEWLMPEAQCQGTYSFEYSIIPHSGCWENAWKEACAFAAPMKAVVQRELEEDVMPWFAGKGFNDVLPASHSFIRIEPDFLHVSAIKKHESKDTLVIRLVNLNSKTTIGRISVDIPHKKIIEAFAVGLDEERKNSLETDEDSWIHISLKPKGLLTIEVVLQ
jgi:alpha-mannosidase